MVALSAERHLVDPARYRYGGSVTGLIASAIIVNPEMQVDGICRRLVYQPQITPKRLPLNPARGRKPTIRTPKSCLLQQRPACGGQGRTIRRGSKCRSKSGPRTKVCTTCTPPLAGQTHDERTLPALQKAAIRGRSTKKIRLRHVVTTTFDHERVKANNWPAETAKKDAT
jgi:hypothetical protein